VLGWGVNAAAENIIAQLRLAPLPREGGYFRQTWLSETRLANGRAAGSAIWFLLTAEDFSALHRLQVVERWHFHAGDPVEHVQLTPGRVAGRVTVLGAEAPTNQLPLVVPVGVWQGARLRPEARTRGWALVGCTLAPAWEDKDF
jgi:predicted cupin superfamily sugar epimerase